MSYSSPKSYGVASAASQSQCLPPVVESALDRLHASIAEGRPQSDSLALLDEVRRSVSRGGGRLNASGGGSGLATVGGGWAGGDSGRSRLLSSGGGHSSPLPPRASSLLNVSSLGGDGTMSGMFRSPHDLRRYRAADGGIKDPLLGLEEALRRHYTGGPGLYPPPQEATGVSTFLTDIIMSEPRVRRESAARLGSSGGHHRDSVVSQPFLPAAPPPDERPESPEPTPDRRDLETPFPFHKMVSGNCGPHGTLLERLFALLRFGRGTTAVYLLDSMNGDTQAAVLSESAEPGVRCGPFTERLVHELTTCIAIRDSCVPTEALWEVDAQRRKDEDRARRFPLLAASKAHLPSIDTRLDFAVDRPCGLLESLESLLPGSVVCRSSCRKAAPRQFVPPSRGGRACSVFVTDEWVEVGIEPWPCCITSYAIASICPITGGSPPRNWVLEVCHGNGPWHTLREHTNDEGISRHRNYCVWDVPANLRTIVANRFRIRRTGPDGRNGSTLQVAHLELYGRFMCCWPNGLATSDATSDTFGARPAMGVAETRFVTPPLVPLPLEPVSAVKKKKKK